MVKSHFKMRWKMKYFEGQFNCNYITFIGKLLTELILDLRKCPNQKMDESERFSSLGTSKGPEAISKAV